MDAATALRESIRNGIDDAIWAAFAEAYDKAWSYYDEDELD